LETGNKPFFCSFAAFDYTPPGQQETWVFFFQMINGGWCGVFVIFFL
jgi:hypothetical protein